MTARTTAPRYQCQYGDEDQVDYTLTDTHTYNAPGDYLI